MLFFITVVLVLVLCSRVLSFSLVSRFILVAFLSSLFVLLLFSVFFCIVLILFRYLIVFGLRVSFACYFVFSSSFYSCVVLLFSFRFFFFFFHVSFFCRSRVLTSPFRSLAVLLVVPPSRSTHRRPRFAPDFGQGDRENKQLLLACSRTARCCGHHREFVLVLGEKIHISAHGPMYVLGWRGEGGGEESERKGEKEGGRGIE